MKNFISEEQLILRLVALEALVAELGDDYNDLVTKFNAHTHTYNPTLTSTSVATSAHNQSSPSALDVSSIIHRPA